MRRLLTISLMTFAAVVVAAQAPPRAVDAFEVATVKPNTSGEATMGLRRVPGGLIATNAPLSSLISIAYGLEPFQMTGGPDWLTSARFDVTARLAEGPDRGQDAIRTALQALLSERFKLAVRWESRERPVYVLTKARTDGTLGPNLKPSPIDCAARQAEAAAAAREGRPAPPPLPPSTPDSVSCGLWNTGERMLAGGYGLSPFVTTLANELDRMVIDRTGLEGVWTLEMTYARQRQPRPGTEPPANPDAPSIFTAVREQLGLRLDPTDAPVQMLVVDRAEPPSAD